MTPSATPSSRSLTTIFIGLAQWPLCLAVLSGSGLDLTQPGIPWDPIGVGLSGTSILLWLLARQGRHPLALRLLGAALLAVASMVIFREQPVEVSALFLMVVAVAVAVAAFRSGHSRTSLLLTNATFVLAVFVFVESLSGLWVSLAPQRATETWDGSVTTADDVRSARVLPDATAQHRASLADGTLLFDVTYRTGPDGTRRVPDRPDTGRTWHIFGGSYTFGNGLEDDQTIANQIQRRLPDTRVFNHGCAGYGTSEAYQTLCDVLADRSDPAVFIYLFLDDHFRRTAVPRVMLDERWLWDKPRFVLDEAGLQHLGKVSDNLAWTDRLHDRLSERSWVYRRLLRARSSRWVPGPADQDLVASIIVEMKQRSDLVPGCRFVVVRLPMYPSDFDESALQRWHDVLRNHGVEVLDFSPILKNCIRRDKLSLDSCFYPTDGHAKPRYVEYLMEWLAPYMQRWRSETSKSSPDPSG